MYKLRGYLRIKCMTVHTWTPSDISILNDDFSARILQFIEGPFYTINVT